MRVYHVVELRGGEVGIELEDGECGGESVEEEKVEFR